jgi:ribosomal protein L21E
MLDNIEKQINLIEDVRELRQLQQVIKDRKQALGNKLKQNLSVGDKVNINGSNKVESGVILKLNRTRAVVDIKGTSWNVPFSMLGRV